MRALAAVGLALWLSGCASLTTSPEDTVSVVTPNVEGASCQLSNALGTWQVASTPGSAAVSRSSSDMVVVCEKEGFRKATRTFVPSTNAAATASALGFGFIGLAVDASTGAAYSYPMEMIVPMRKARLLEATPLPDADGATPQR
jgi:hypothetical protein